MQNFIDNIYFILFSIYVDIFRYIINIIIVYIDCRRDASYVFPIQVLKFFLQSCPYQSNMHIYKS